MKANDDSDVMNAREAAAYLKAHVETVRRLARRGEIPVFKVGRDWRFHRETLRRWSGGFPSPPAETGVFRPEADGANIRTRRNRKG